MSEEMAPGPGLGTRRTLLAGAAAVGAVVVLAACGENGGPGVNGDSTGAGPAQPTAGGASSAGAVLAKVGDVPVGSGRIFADRGVVVTQPAAGVFKGFSAVCTHQGCPLANVDAGTINCTCHGSRFSIEDGTPKNGPATRPLRSARIEVRGENIVLA